MYTLVMGVASTAASPAQASGPSVEEYQMGSTIVRLKRLMVRQDLELRTMQQTAATMEEQMEELELLQRQRGGRAKAAGQAQSIIDTQIELRRLRQSVAATRELVRKREQQLHARAGLQVSSNKRGIELLPTPWFSESNAKGAFTLLKRNMQGAELSPDNFTTRKLHFWRRTVETPQLGADGRASTCAVVGSAGSLLEREDGGAIDAAEIVIRTNGAPVSARLQQHIGSRTSLYINAHPFPWFKHDGPQVVLCNQHAFCWDHIGGETRNPSRRKNASRVHTRDTYDRLSPQLWWHARTTLLHLPADHWVRTS